jgi:hypothetical protein
MDKKNRIKYCVVIHSEYIIIILILLKITGLTLEGEEVALWLLPSLCTSAKREVEVTL